MEINQPLPSSPTRLPKVCLYVKTRRGEPLAFNYAELYAAHRAFEMLRNDTVQTWVNDRTVQFGNLVEVSTLRPQDIEKVAEYEPTQEEIDWVMPEPYASILRSVASGLYKEPGRAAPTRSQLRREARKSSSSPAPSRAGLTTIADLAAQHNMTPTKARALLRAAKISKPSIGWAFTNEQLPAVKKALDNS